jgi:F-type H+-transporting ATPase subunit delta
VRIPKQARRDAKQLFRSCAVNGVLDTQRARQAVDQVLALKPRGYVAILSHFQRLVKLDLDRRAARVESVAQLDAATEAGIRANLERRYGPGLNFTFSLNPGLLGGVRIQVGSDVIDGSVQSRLAALQDSF